MEKIDRVPIDRVSVNPGNPRLIKDEAYRRLVKSLQDCPRLLEARPLLCSNRTGGLVCLGGNMRLRAAQELGYREVPVVVMDGLTEEQEREIAIKDNGQFGEWDSDVLANEWSDLPLVEWGVNMPEMPDFAPGTEEDQGKLDQLEPKIVKCPHCGEEFDLREQE